MSTVAIPATHHPHDGRFVSCPCAPVLLCCAAGDQLARYYYYYFTNGMDHL
jgi:hypothetical protein